MQQVLQKAMVLEMALVELLEMVQVWHSELRFVALVEEA